MHQVKAIKYQEGVKSEVTDGLTVEEMISISINENAYTITMRTPGNEAELIRGILLTEDVLIENTIHPKIVFTEKNEFGFITKANVIIDEKYLGKGIDTKRNLMSVTSCGMCGKEELDLDLGNTPIETNEKIKATSIQKMFEIMSEHQNTFKHSGGSHASAAFTTDTKLLGIFEDIGRHNAVDKVIGGLILSNQILDAKCLTVSGRISYEIVSKCYKAGIPFLAAVSAPSSMAVDYCSQLGITLLAFCRDEKCTVYSCGERVE